MRVWRKKSRKHKIYIILFLILSMTRISPKIIDTYTTSTVVQDLSNGGLVITAAERIATFSTRRKSCLIYNDGPNPVHINFDATATVNNFIIPSKWSMSIVFPVTVLHFISDGTSTLYILGER